MGHSGAPDPALGWVYRLTRFLRLVLAALLAAAPGCSRSGLEEPVRGGAADEFTVLDAAPSATAISDPPTPVSSTEPPQTIATEPSCVPVAETCNGKDDDCDGVVDDNLPAIPCPGGGSKYCVAGKYSACPTRCEECLPGSERVCFLSYCTYWATETCSADGRSFGTCREAPVPSECSGVASGSKASAALEQCCLDNGYCCHDEFDLDRDGDTNEMLGQCDDVSCGS